MADDVDDNMARTGATSSVFIGFKLKITFIGRLRSFPSLFMKSATSLDTRMQSSFSCKTQVIWIGKILLHQLQQKSKKKQFFFL